MSSITGSSNQQKPSPSVQLLNCLAGEDEEDSQNTMTSEVTTLQEQQPEGRSPKERVGMGVCGADWEEEAP